jgi:hypothetical protein
VRDPLASALSRSAGRSETCLGATGPGGTAATLRSLRLSTSARTVIRRRAGLDRPSLRVDRVPELDAATSSLRSPGCWSRRAFESNPRRPMSASSAQAQQPATARAPRRWTTAARPPPAAGLGVDSCRLQRCRIVRRTTWRGLSATVAVGRATAWRSASDRRSDWPGTRMVAASLYAEAPASPAPTSVIPPRAPSTADVTPSPPPSPVAGGSGKGAADNLSRIGCLIAFPYWRASVL